MSNIKSKLTIIFCTLLSVSLLLLVFLNFYRLKKPVLLTMLKQGSFSASVGDSYFHRLRLWYYFVSLGDWAGASRFEQSLDSADISLYKQYHSPANLNELKEKLISKSTKTADDWLELAIAQVKLGDTKNAVQSLKEAYTLDPVRSDVSSFFYSLGEP